MPSGLQCDKLFMEKIEELMKRREYESDAELVKLIQKMCGTDESAAWHNLRAVKAYLNIKKNIVFKYNVEKLLKPTMLFEIARATEEKKQEILKGLEEGTVKTVADARAIRVGNTTKRKKEIDDILLKSLETDYMKYSNRLKLETVVKDTITKLKQLESDADKEGCTVIVSRLSQILGFLQVFSIELKEVKGSMGGEKKQ